MTATIRFQFFTWVRVGGHLHHRDLIPAASRARRSRWTGG